ncbi:DegV family EDD domain-containing protein [Marinifilum sp. N1E240]|uniref:DegV family protein n=1 Tax=Marinifilum sp. N1E240 TaxID=2608082 RepID=UPI00128E1DFA|nr:DegV family protein [Marinifilum sp. N1E240]MPQ46808.1 DegV family EDD domain-containing protein [Marinifilum sp. N1E240]
MNIDPIRELDGRNLYYTFVAGAKRVFEHQAEINRINVFPVNDKDTGTNLVATLQAILDNTSPNKSYKTTADNIAEAALIGARGNSGIIFAQFLYGLSMETVNEDKIKMPDFASSVNNSITYIYDAISNPVEGTMLTVIRDWAEYIHSNKDLISDFNQIFLSSLETLKKSLFETTGKLKVLSKANVVDAGAKGFVLFIEGIIDFIKNGNIQELMAQNHTSAELPLINENIENEITYRYCTEAVIKNFSWNSKQLKDLLEKNGDSVVVAGSSKMQRLHFHTNHPDQVFQELKDSGTITFQKIDDMVRQNEMAIAPKAKIALVTDSTCDLPQEILDHYQINMIPINLYFGQNHYLDRLTIQHDQFYEMLDSNAEFPVTSQCNTQSFEKLYNRLADYYDAVISIHLSEKLSGTINNAIKAADKISSTKSTPIHVIDSKGVSGALGLQVLKIAEAIASGIQTSEIIESLKVWQNNTNIFVSVKTLKYMVKGGRVSHTKGIIARLLNINPIISLGKDGKSLVFGKTYTHKSNLKLVMKTVAKLTEQKNVWKYIILHANNPEAANWYKSQMKKLSKQEPVAVVNISPVIAMHAGVGTAAVALITE